MVEPYLDSSLYKEGEVAEFQNFPPKKAVSQNFPKKGKIGACSKIDEASLSDTN